MVCHDYHCTVGICYPFSGGVKKRGVYVPRPRKPEEEKRKNVNISIPGWMYLWLKEHGSYSNLIEALVLIYMEEVEKERNVVKND